MAALVAVGVPEAVARERVAGQYDPAEGRDSGTVAVMPCNWEAVTLLVQMPASCWRRPAMGGKPEGLRRDQVKDELLLRGVRRRTWPALWERIRVMERVALEEWALRG